MPLRRICAVFALAALLFVTGCQNSVPYEIVQRSSIPDGGDTVLVTIAPTHLNVQDMTVLGGQFRENTKSDKKAFISVFTDRRAAQLRDRVVSQQATDEERALYYQSWVAQYNRNLDTGLHQYEFCLGGFVNRIDCTTIKY